MRLLLDEHYLPEIGELLRSKGHDVVCAVARRDLAGLTDEALLSTAITQARALVTENVKHFIPLTTDKIIQGGQHYGLILTSASSLPSSRDRIGTFVERLSTLLEGNPASDAFVNRTHWLG